MSESTFPFTGVDGEAEEDRGSRRVLLLVGGLAATAALGLGGFLLLGSGAEDDLPTGVPPVLAAGAAPTASVAPAAATLPRAFDEQLGRNPFKALYVVPAGTTGGTTGEQAGGDPTVDGAAAPAGPVGTGAVPAQEPVSVAAPEPALGGPLQPAGPPPAGPVTTSAPVAPSAPTDREYALVLRSVSGEGSAQRARFTLDGAPVEAAVGDRFGATQEIRLISLQEGPGAQEWTAVLQVGDGDPFDAVTGQAVSVR